MLVFVLAQGPHQTNYSQRLYHVSPWFETAECTRYTSILIKTGMLAKNNLFLCENTQTGN